MGTVFISINHRAFRTGIYFRGTSALNQSGFNETIKPVKPGIGPVYDGENIVFYYKDMTQMPFWMEKQKRGNWNQSLKETIEKSDHYKRTNDKPKAKEMWDQEKERKNVAMFSDASKVHHIKSY